MTYITILAIISLIITLFYFRYRKTYLLHLNIGLSFIITIGCIIEAFGGIEINYGYLIAAFVWGYNTIILMIKKR